jgi:WD40 repeat protein
LISADSIGDIFAWRCDAQGWYQLLRKLKRENIKQSVDNHDGVGGILSLSMHPDKNKGQMLVFSKNPSNLRVLNMSTYKSIIHCAGFCGVSPVMGATSNFISGIGSVFSRSCFSSDGRFVACGSFSSAHGCQYKLQLWDSAKGNIIRSSISG